MTDLPKIAALCPSYNRPNLLGQAIAMFMAQDYPNKELIILEDSGIFDGRDVHGENWRLVSTSDRYVSVGAKRNALIAMTDAPLIASWDDDDWYLPRHLSAAVNALQTGLYCQSRQALEWHRAGVPYRTWTVSLSILKKLNDGIKLTPRECWDVCYGGQWSFQKHTVLRAGGYPAAIGNGDDTDLCRRMGIMFGNSVDAICPDFPDPTYVYSRNQSGSWHASELGPGTDPLKKLASLPRQNPDDLRIELPNGYNDIKMPKDIRVRAW